MPYPYPWLSVTGDLGSEVAPSFKLTELIELQNGTLASPLYLSMYVSIYLSIYLSDTKAELALSSPLESPSRYSSVSRKNAQVWSSVDTCAQKRINRLLRWPISYAPVTYAKSGVFFQSRCVLNFWPMITVWTVIERQSFLLSVDRSFAWWSSMVTNYNWFNRSVFWNRTFEFISQIPGFWPSRIFA